MRSTFNRWLGAAALALGLAAAPAQAQYTDMYVFGDSLSDTGNIAFNFGGLFPPPPYFNGRFSDGPIWIDHLATGLGLPDGAKASLAGGNNYAFGGARTGTDLSPPGLLAQFGGLYAPTHPVADPNALYVVVGGGNDMRDARTDFPGSSVSDGVGRQNAAVQAAANLTAVVGGLAQLGARHFLLANLPDLGRTPEAVGDGVVAASSDATERFNAEINLLAIIGTNAGLDIMLLDLNGIAAGIVANPGAFGITNTTLPCNAFTGGSNPLNDCAVSAFSDDLHPSARVHAIFGAAALQAVGVVPEPETMLLLAAGLLVVVRRARRA